MNVQIASLVVGSQIDFIFDSMFAGSHLTVFEHWFVMKRRSTKQPGELAGLHV